MTLRAFGRRALLAAALLWLCFGRVLPAAAVTAPAEAAELTAAAYITSSSGNAAALADGRESSYTKLAAGSTVTVHAEAGIASLYVIFDRIYGPWTLTDGSAEALCGQQDFLHEYVDVAAAFGYAPQTVTLRFGGSDCALSELHIFGSGAPPAWVQRWQPPCEEADLLLASTHIDDEQLFFAGVLPYYAGERGLAVQVVYFTDPFSYHDRPHEQLNGLWTVGVRHYPVCGPYADAYSETLRDAYAHQAALGYDKEHMVRFQAAMLRRFRPQVVVGHDAEGEYGHGQHRINSETLREALALAADAGYDPESAAAYGVWDTPKAYIHLWPENPIVMDWDIPLEAFGGKTAFQVTQEGFLCHESQQWTWFRGWIFGKNGVTITEARQIKRYSPCLYGLFRTTVGPDVAGGDMFENIPCSYAELRAEEARQAALEQERLEAERLAAEEAARQAEQQAIREAEALRAQQAAAREQRRRQVALFVALPLALAALLGLAFTFGRLLRAHRPQK